MFIVVNRNNNTGIYSVLDTDDGVVDKLYTYELFDIVRATGIKIRCLFPEPCKFYSNYMTFNYDNIFFKVRTNRVDGFVFNHINMYGHFKVCDKCYRNYYSDTDARALYNILDQGQFSGLSRLIFYAYTCLISFNIGDLGATNLILRALYNWRISSSGDYSVSVSLKSKDSYLNFTYDLPFDDVEVFEYGKYIYFVDPLLVLEIEKSRFNRLDSLTKVSNKLNMLKNVKTEQTSNGNLKIIEGESLTITGEEGFKYTIDNSTKLNELKIKGEATSIIRLGHSRLHLDKLYCESPLAFNSLQKKHGLVVINLILDMRCVGSINVKYCVFNTLQVNNPTNYKLSHSDYKNLVEAIEYNTCYKQHYTLLTGISNCLLADSQRSLDLFKEPIEFDIDLLLSSLTKEYTLEFLSFNLTESITMKALLRSYFITVFQKYAGRLFSDLRLGALIYEKEHFVNTCKQYCKEFENYIDSLNKLCDFVKSHNNAFFDCNRIAWSSYFNFIESSGNAIRFRLTDKKELSMAIDYIKG